jgi:ribosomal protein S18 acetylase RimI-like enzyme
VTAHPLDNPVWSLAGPHARFVQRRGNVLRYPADVSPFIGLPDEPGAADWADLAALAGPGAVVALAGVRVPPPADWTEISAVCTDERWRGYGFASWLTRMLVAGIRARGDTPFLHALASNAGAIGLYEALGFQFRRTMAFSAVRVPDAEPAARGYS